MPRLSTGPRADRTPIRRPEADLAAHPGCGLGKGERDANANIGTTCGPGPHGTEAPKTGSSAKELAKNVIQYAEVAEEILAAERLSAVVGATPLRVRQHFVGLGDLPKLGFRLGIVGIRIGMRITGEAAKRLLDVILRGIARDAEEVVVLVHAVPSDSAAEAISEAVADFLDDADCAPVVHSHRPDDADPAEAMLAGLVRRRDDRKVHALEVEF